MVFQRPNPFPKSIYDNVAYGLRILGMKDDLDERVERALRGAALWDEVQGPPQEVRARPLRRPAAAPLHRARDRRRAGRDPPRRAGVGARPDLDLGDRGPDARAEARLHARDRHAQHAAGRARRRDDGVLQPRRQGGRVAQRHPRRVRRDREDLHAARPTSAPRVTSPDGSVEGLASRRSSTQLEAALQEEGDLVLRVAPLVAERARARRRGARRRGDPLRRRGRPALRRRSRRASSRCSRGRRRSRSTCGSCSRCCASTCISSGWPTTA